MDTLIENAPLDQITGSRYLLPLIDCTSDCPNHPEFNKEFGHFCNTCYTRISKLHKPRLQTLQLPLSQKQIDAQWDKLAQQQQTTPEAFAFANQAAAFLDALVDRPATHAPAALAEDFPHDTIQEPRASKSLNRPRCGVCNARLALHSTASGCGAHYCGKHQAAGAHHCGAVPK